MAKSATGKAGSARRRATRADLEAEVQALREQLAAATDALAAMRVAHGGPAPAGPGPLDGNGAGRAVHPREAAEALRRLAQFPEQNPNPVLRVAATGELLYANAAARALLPALGATAAHPVPPVLRALAAEAAREERGVGRELADGNGRVHWFAAVCPRHEAYANLYALDITGRKAMEEELRRARDQLELRVQQRTAELAVTVRQLEAEKAVTERAAALAQVTARLLHLFAEKTARRDYLEAAAALLQEWSRCRCVGIRVLREDGGLPYEAQVGFGADFLRQEMELNAADAACVCVRVATHAAEPQDEPALTAGGSFVCVDTPTFVAGLAPADLPRYRGVCVRMGFRTLAVVPIRYRGRPLGAIHLADEQPGMLSAEDIEFLESRALLIGEALHRFSLEEEVLAISEEERRRVDQELHDNLGQQLTGVAYSVDLLEDSLASQARPEAGEASVVRTQLGEAIARVRDLSHGLYPVRLGAGGLAPALAELAEGVRARRGVACVFECDEGATATDERVAIHLYRIAQEAVNNALKHAEARHITIRLLHDERGLCLEIADDGVGLPRDAASRKGLGLHIMQYRAENLGGRFEVLAPPGGGTLVRCSAVGPPKAGEKR